MKQIYYPKYNITLIDGSDIFIKSFVCFLDKIYILKIDNSKEAKNILIECLDILFENSLLEAKKQTKQYCHFIFYINFNSIIIDENLSNFIDIKKINKIINQFILKFKDKFIFYRNKKDLSLSFKDKKTIKNTVLGEEQEILYILQKKLKHKVALT